MNGYQYKVASVPGGTSDEIIQDNLNRLGKNGYHLSFVQMTHDIDGDEWVTFIAEKPERLVPGE